ncbi:hypothetical protein MtrunA17_Chr5g0401901 [Medicago truncatula]|uniref:Uncharacterized protein n=1 Tax=Medicago truncatula TaxID=3880 RepID=A0A396HRK0_MEDTR|nr:hypothetical protein MtrunA17_Chr5g0401901 [Medicago truncatula]
MSHNTLRHNLIFTSIMNEMVKLPLQLIQPVIGEITHPLVYFEERYM